LKTRKAARTVDIQGKLILLGTGTSVGVPALGCSCPVCCSNDPKNYRTRCSAIFGLPGGNLLIDTPPDLRQQLIREGLGLVHAVCFTHEHADHIFGLDDLRLMQFYLEGPVPLYCNAEVELRLRESFSYAFEQRVHTHAGAVPSLEFHRIGLEPFAALGTTIQPILFRHGPRFEVFGFRVGNVAYCTDVKEIPLESWPLLEGLDTLVLSALRYDPHPTHLNLAEALAVVERLRPRQAYFTHCSCHLDYHKVNAELPAGVQLAYDGLQIPLV
jgi:phosphoribosyl 1,2-cyclic phosphate phosphodiesterase